MIGRRTFDLGVGPWGGTPWPGVPSFVVTHRTREDLLGDNGGTFAFDGLQPAVRRAKDAAEDKDVLVLGAHVARELLRAGLLDEVRIHLVPLLMGRGRARVHAARMIRVHGSEHTLAIELDVETRIVCRTATRADPMRCLLFPDRSRRDLVDAPSERCRRQP